MKYKKGDVILFLENIFSDSAGGKKLKIPKLTPVTINRINKHHIWVEYEKNIIWLRYIEKRMIPFTEASVILFNESNHINSR
jgi:hypothetical protein